MKIKIEVDGKFSPVGQPVADTDEMASLGQRLMFRINVHAGGIEVFTARKGELTAGWVIALLD